MKGGQSVEDILGAVGGAKRSKTSKCHCGLPGCICRCAKNNCPKNCRCMKCRRGRKSRRRRSSMKVGGTCTNLFGISSCGGRRRGRPCKSTRKKKKNKKNKTKTAKKL